MSNYQKERMRRKEFEQQQQQAVADAAASRSKKRRLAVIAAMIVAAVAAILVIAPMRFRAIASNDLDDVEQYLMENVDESIVAAGSVVEGQMEAQDEGDNAFMMFAESIAGTEEDTVDTTDKVILAKYLLVDSEFVSDGMTIDDIYADEEFAGMSVISQYANTMPLLTTDEDSPYYVAMLDTAQFNGYGHVLTADFAWTNTNGEVIEDIVYDREKGIAYVPKHLFDEGSYDPAMVDEEFPVQAQLLVAYDLSAQTTDMAQVEIPLTVVSEVYDVRATEATSFLASSFDTSVTVPIVVPEDAGKISKKNILICDGGSDFAIPLGDDTSSYDSETGELTIAVNALTLTSLNVTIISEDYASQMIDAVFMPSEAEAISPDSMKTWGKGALTSLDLSKFDAAVKGKAVYRYSAPVLRVGQQYIESTNKSDLEKKWLAAMKAAASYLYGPKTGNHVANDEMQLDIYTGGDFSDVANDNNIELIGSGEYYWQRGGGINEGFAFPGYAGVDANVTTRIDAGKGTSIPLNMSGIGSLTDDPGMLVGSGLCAHVKEKSVMDNDTDFADTKHGSGLDKNAYVIMRPLYRDPKNQYVVVAFIGARVSTQSGCGVYKFRIQQPGYAKLVKTSKDANVTGNNGAYTLDQAKYDVYASAEDANAGKNPVGTLTTDANGNSNTLTVKPGQYWAKEVAAPAGYKLDAAVLGPVAIAEGQVGTFQASDEPLLGSISVKKQDAETSKGLASGTYKMTLYAADKKTALKSVDITKDETVSFGSYGFGTYYVHEDSATFPYMTEEFAVDANAAWHQVVLDSNQQAVTIAISDPQRRGEVILNKVNEANEPVAGASFSLYANQDVTSLDGTPRHEKGKKITVKENSVGDYVFDAHSENTTLLTDAQGHIKVSGLYLTTDATSFQMVEEKPAPGYLLDTTPVVFTLAKDESVKVISATQTMVNHDNGIDIYTYEENPTNPDPNGPDPDDPTGGYPNVLIANKLVGVWKKEDNLSFSPDEGKGGIAIRTPSGDAQYKPTLTPVGKGCVVNLDQWLKDVPVRFVNLTTEEETEVTKSGETLAAGNYDIYATDASGKSHQLSTVVSGVVASSDGTISVIAKGDDVADGADISNLLGSASALHDADYDPDELIHGQGMETLVGEWDANLNAWIVKNAEINATYKVIIASKGITNVTIGKQISYARYALEESEMFAKGWTGQAGLPIDDAKYAYKGATDASAHAWFNRIPEGAYYISEIKPPADTTGNFSYLADCKIHTFVVDGKTGLIKDSDDISLGYHTDKSAVESRRQAFVIREPKTHLLISKRSSETNDDVAGAQLILTNERHEVVAEWTSDGNPHTIDGLIAGTYYLSEAVTPQNYDKATTVVIKVKPVSTPQSVVMYDAPLVAGVAVDKRQEIADPLDERHMENGDGKNNAALSVDKFGYYDYSIDVRSTANSWVDELTVTDEPKAVTDGMARLVSIATPQAWQDYDGKMNVWYKTNKTPADYKDEGNANATLSDGHQNYWLGIAGASGLDTDGDKRVEDYAGWKLWQADLPTMVSTTLEVKDLGLGDDEYVTGVRFEYGRVEMGFTTRPSDWDRELLKSEHDDVDDILGADRMTFDAADAAADAATTKLTTLVNGFATDASRAAESVISERTKAEEETYQKLIKEIEAYNNNITPDSDLPRKFIDAPEAPAYLGDDDAVTKLTAARDAAKVSIRAIFETSNTPEGKVALSEALPGLKALVAGATSDDTSSLIEQKVQDLITAINKADADSMSAIQESLIEDLDQAVDDIINTGLAGRVHYSPAIIHMQVTDAYVADSSLSNGTSAVTARNGGGASDSDGTGQTSTTEDAPAETTPKDGDKPGATPTPTPTPGTTDLSFESFPLAAKDEDMNFQSAKDRVIEIDTNLALPDGSKTLTVEEGRINPIDHVNISGLTPGKEYVLVGEIHSRMGSANEGFVDAGVVKNNDGQPVTSIMTFTPNAESTSVDVPFTIDVERLNAYPAVAFEELHESIDGQPGDIVLAEHKDITDPDQTINLDPAQFDTITPTEQVRRIFKGTPLAQTGDAVLIGGVAAIAVASGVGIILWRRRSRA